MYKKLIIVFIMSFFSGCSFTNVTFTSNEVKTSKKIYKDISKDAILEASKKIFILANKKEFIIDSYRNRIEVSRVLFENKIYNVDLYLDKWIVEVYQFENETRVELSLVRTDGVEQVKNISIPEDVFDLFWTRLDFLLGLNNNWEDCRSYQFKRVIFDTTLCNKFFFSDAPEKKDIVTDIYISERKNKNYTIDKVKPIFSNQDLSKSIYSYNFQQTENIEDVKINQPIIVEEIFEEKEDNSFVDEKEQIEKFKNELNNTNTVQENVTEEDIKEFSESINSIINNRKSNK